MRDSNNSEPPSGVLSNVVQQKTTKILAKTISGIYEEIRQGMKSLDVEQIKEIYPLISTEDIVGGVFIPQDGQADPVGVTNVLAKAAKQNGAKIIEKCYVKKILTKNNIIDGVETNKGKLVPRRKIFKWCC